MKAIALLVLVTTPLCVLAQMQAPLATLREGIALDQESSNPARLQDPQNSDKRQPRDYPMQPPTIPHQITNYQVDLKANKCLSCHARTRTGESKAPMVSVTHFMDRDGNFLADVSPRRYFCTQCHVPKIEKKPIVENTFIDMHELIKAEGAGK